MDRRLYQRITVNAEGVFILDNTNVSPREFPGIVEDISEGGMKITMTREESNHILPYLSTGKNLHFHASDDFKLFGMDKEAIISGQVEILRQENVDDFVILGCKFKRKTSELMKYISDRKISLFMNNLQRNMA